MSVPDKMPFSLKTISALIFLFVRVKDDVKSSLVWSSLIAKSRILSTLFFKALFIFTFYFTSQVSPAPISFLRSGLNLSLAIVICSRTTSSNIGA